MRRRFLISAVTTWLCLMTYGCAWAAGGVPIWVALSESGGPHVEAATALVAEVDQAQACRVDLADRALESIRPIQS